MTSWVGSISFDQRDNWEICKAKSLFGSPKSAALDVVAGDDFFIWGAKQGWLAWCRATADAERPGAEANVPWPEPWRYHALIPMSVIHEPQRPIAMSEAEIKASSGLHTAQLRNFTSLDPASAERLRNLLGSTPERLPIAPAEAATAGGELPALEGRQGFLLSALTELRTDRQLGVPAPYQQLVLLRSIVGAVEGATGSATSPTSGTS